MRTVVFPNAVKEDIRQLFRERKYRSRRSAKVIWVL